MHNPQHAPVRVMHTNGTKAQVAVSGELNLATGQVVLRKLSSLIDRGYVHLEVDASEVSFCDSSGLGALLRARARVSSAAGGLTVSKASARLQRVLHVAGLQKLVAGAADAGDKTGGDRHGHAGATLEHGRGRRDPQ